MPPKNRLFVKCSSEAIHNSPLASPYTEEKVVTMVEMENERNKGKDTTAEEDCKTPCLQDDDILRKLIGKVASDGKVSRIILVSSIY